MITKILTTAEIKTILSETFLANTDKITKLSDVSVINAIFFSQARIARGLMKDVGLIESQILPDSAYGDFLDIIASNRGIPLRYGALGSSTYLRLVANPGTTYIAGFHNFISKEGVNFTLDTNSTIGNNGFAYAKVNSTSIGRRTNVEPLSINTINNAPIGHKFVTNEFKATGGRDIESDEIFRIRIKNYYNLFATSTLNKLALIFNRINPDVLRVFHNGFNSKGQVILMVVSESGKSFLNSEFDEMLVKSQNYLSLIELRSNYNNSIGVELRNVIFQPVDISFRCELYTNISVDDTRLDIQNRIASYLDYRFWDYERKVEWDNLLQIVKSSPGVKYVYDNDFSPRVDLRVNRNSLPRLRGFLMLDKIGNIITTNLSTLNPIYYPAIKDFNYQNTLFSSI